MVLPGAGCEHVTQSTGEASPPTRRSRSRRPTSHRTVVVHVPRRLHTATAPEQHRIHDCTPRCRGCCPCDVAEADLRCSPATRAQLASAPCWFVAPSRVRPPTTTPNEHHAPADAVSGASAARHTSDAPTTLVRARRALWASVSTAAQRIDGRRVDDDVATERATASCTRHRCQGPDVAHHGERHVTTTAPAAATHRPALRPARREPRPCASCTDAPRPPGRCPTTRRLQHPRSRSHASPVRRIALAGAKLPAGGIWLRILRVARMRR